MISSDTTFMESIPTISIAVTSDVYPRKPASADTSKSLSYRSFSDMLGVEETAIEFPDSFLAHFEFHSITLNIEYLNDIENIYMMRLPEEIKAWLFLHPSIADVLIEAHSHIIDSFGDTAQIRIQIVKDPEASDFEELIAYIITGLPVPRALESLDQFDNQWFLDQVDRLDGNFNFCLEII